MAGAAALALAGARWSAAMPGPRVASDSRPRRVAGVTGRHLYVDGYEWAGTRYVVAVLGVARAPADPEIVWVDMVTGTRRVVRVLSATQYRSLVPLGGWSAPAAVSPDRRWLICRTGPGGPGGMVSLTDSRFVTWAAGGKPAGLAWWRAGCWVALEGEARGYMRAVYRNLKARRVISSYVLRGPPGQLIGTDRAGHLLVLPDSAYQSGFPRLDVYAPTGGGPRRTFRLPVRVAWRGGPAGTLSGNVALDRSGARAVVPVDTLIPTHGGRYHHRDVIDLWYGRVGGPFRRVARIPPIRAFPDYPSMFRFRPDGRMLSFVQAGSLWVLPLPR